MKSIYFNSQLITRSKQLIAGCFVISLSFFPALSLATETPSCAAYFPRGVQSHSENDQVQFLLNAETLANPDRYISTRKIIVGGFPWSTSCGSQSCIATGTPAPALNLPDFQNTSSSQNLNLFLQSYFITAQGNHYRDISVGLAGDARHIAKASEISITFGLNPSDFDPDLVLFCKKYKLDPIEFVLSGGEDYELLFTCKPSTFKRIKKDLPLAIQVGHCLPFNETHILNLPPDVSSFQHGR